MTVGKSELSKKFHFKGPQGGDMCVWVSNNSTVYVQRWNLVRNNGES